VHQDRRITVAHTTTHLQGNSGGAEVAVVVLLMQKGGMLLPTPSTHLRSNAWVTSPRVHGDAVCTSALHCCQRIDCLSSAGRGPQPMYTPKSYVAETHAASGVYWIDISWDVTTSLHMPFLPMPTLRCPLVMWNSPAQSLCLGCGTRQPLTTAHNPLQLNVPAYQGKGRADANTLRCSQVLA
jgi:hypothetical protein